MTPLYAPTLAGTNLEFADGCALPVQNLVVILPIVAFCVLFALGVVFAKALRL